MTGCCLCTSDIDVSEKMQYSTSTSSILTAILVSVILSAVIYACCVSHKIFVVNMASICKTAPEL